MATIIQEGELAVIDFAVNFLETNTTQLEADLQPFEVVLVNGAIKLVDELFAKLPLGLGGLLNGLLEGYSSQIPGDLNQFVGIGITFVVNYLKALRAHISAS